MQSGHTVEALIDCYMNRVDRLVNLQLLSGLPYTEKQEQLPMKAPRTLLHLQRGQRRLHARQNSIRCRSSSTTSWRSSIAGASGSSCDSARSLALDRARTVRQRSSRRASTSATEMISRKGSLRSVALGIPHGVAEHESAMCYDYFCRLFAARSNNSSQRILSVVPTRRRMIGRLIREARRPVDDLRAVEGHLREVPFHQSHPHIGSAIGRECEPYDFA